MFDRIVRSLFKINYSFNLFSNRLWTLIPHNELWTMHIKFRNSFRKQYFAAKADVKGYNDVAAVFRSTAEGETGHAHGHLEYLEETGDPATGLPMGGTSDNLKAAIAGETHEYTDMYPGMAKTARDEGFDEIADWFETLAKAERSHANRFQKALDTLDS